MTGKNLYDVLGIGKNATPKDVRRAYREKAKETHPDTGGDTETFAEVNEAWEVLNDPVKRAQYDSTGTYLRDEDVLTRAQNHLPNVFITLLESLGEGAKTQDVIHLMADHCAEVKGTAHKILREREKKLELWTNLGDRISYRGEGRNLLSDTITARIQIEKAEILRLKQDIAVASKMIELVNQYDWKVTKAKEPVGIFHDFRKNTGMFKAEELI